MSFVCLNTRLKKLVSRERELGSIQSNNLISSGIKLLKGKKKTTKNKTPPTNKQNPPNKNPTKPKQKLNQNHSTVCAPGDKTSVLTLLIC